MRALVSILLALWLALLAPAAPFDRLPEVMAALAAQSGGIMCQVIAYR